eukprot:1180034-Prorocentrum_minimum.AAC.5
MTVMFSKQRSKALAHHTIFRRKNYSTSVSMETLILSVERECHVTISFCRNDVRVERCVKDCVGIKIVGKKVFLLATRYNLNSPAAYSMMIAR